MSRWLHRNERVARLMGIAATLAFLLVGGCLLASATRPLPAFVLSPSGASLLPMHYSLLQDWGDRLRGRRYLLLTFDDGPFGHGVDERILATLKRHKAQAIFFTVCRKLTDGGSGVLRRALDAGNLVGNHSYSHVGLTRLGDSALAHEIVDCNDVIAQQTGIRPLFFRPPFGQTSVRVLAEERSSGLQQMLWDANSQDSWQIRPEQILHWSLGQSENLSILLLHSKPATADVLDLVLTSLERRGFVFVLPEEHSVVSFSRHRSS